MIAAVFIRIIGVHNSANEVFHCVHFECPASNGSHDKEEVFCYERKKPEDSLMDFTVAEPIQEND